MQTTYSLFLAAATTLLTASAAAAQTVYVVDDDGGPGVTHTTIRGALSVAGPLDRVDVRAGNYTKFDMVRATKLMGEPGVVVSGNSRLINTLPGSVAVISDMTLHSLSLGNCQGFTFLNNVRLTAANSALVASACNDLRARKLHCTPPSATGPSLVGISNSRVQFTSCEILCGAAPDRSNGQNALTATGTSFVHLTDSQVAGGRGGDFVDPTLSGSPGLGGRAISSNAASIRLVKSTVTGGGGGLDYTRPFNDAANGPGLFACGGLHDLWSSALSGGNEPGNFNAPGPNQIFICGAGFSGGGPLPAAVIRGGGSFLPGDTGKMVLTGGAWTSVTLIEGAAPTNVAVPGSRVPRLVTSDVVTSLGTLRLSGRSRRPFTIPSLPRGSLLLFQTGTTSPFYGTSMSNAEVILVR